MKTLPTALTVSILLSQAVLCKGTTFTDFPSFQAATTNLTLENFDSAPWPGVQAGGLNGTTNFGITWDSAQDLTSTTSVARSGSTSISDVDTPPDVLDMITASIGVNGITAFGAYINNFPAFGQNDTIAMVAFDASSNVLDSVSVFPPSDFEFVGVTSNVDIARVEFSSSGPMPDDDFAIDDVYFGQVIPEPSTIGLLALGLFGIASLRRERRT